MSRLRSQRTRRGFTLLEVLVVITIVAAVIAIGLPRFQAVFDVQIKSAIRKLIGTIRFAFYEAAMKKGYYRVIYDIDQQTYAVRRLTTTGEFIDEGTGFTEDTALPPGIYFKDIVTPHGGKADKGQEFTQFFPNGFSERTVIHLIDEYESEYTLIIQPLSGRVEVYDRYIDIVEGEVR